MKLTVEEIMRTLYGHDPDYLEEGADMDKIWNWWFKYREPFVFIYTYRHDGDNSIAIIPIRTITVPPRDQRMLLELNSSELTNERRREIYDVIFGGFSRENKWNYRTKYLVYIGYLDGFIGHLLENTSNEDLQRILFQFVSSFIDEWDVT